MKSFLLIFVLLGVSLMLFGGSKTTTYKSRWLIVTATAYCPCRICCGSHSNGKTAIMRDANLPGVAVDPKYIPLGSYLDIPGYKRVFNRNGSWIKADDTGRLIKGNKIDVRFKTHKEALKFGKRKIKVRIWER